MFVADFGGSKEYYEERRKKSAAFIATGIRPHDVDDNLLELDVLDGQAVALLETVFDDNTPGADDQTLPRE